MQVDVIYQYTLSIQLFFHLWIFPCIEGFRLNKQLIFSKVGEIRWTGMIKVSLCFCCESCWLTLQILNPSMCGLTHLPAHVSASKLNDESISLSVCEEIAPDAHRNVYEGFVVSLERPLTLTAVSLFCVFAFVCCRWYAIMCLNVADEWNSAYCH